LRRVKLWFLENKTRRLGGRGRKRRRSSAKGLRVEETTPFRLVKDSVLDGLVIPVDDAKVEIG